MPKLIRFPLMEVPKTLRFVGPHKLTHDFFPVARRPDGSRDNTFMVVLCVDDDTGRAIGMQTYADLSSAVQGAKDYAARDPRAKRNERTYRVRVG